MEIEKTNIEGLYIIKPKVFGDERGYFFESFNAKKFLEATGVVTNFVQDNQSKSTKNVLRGLHFQSPPYAQDKLVRVVQGSVLDVVVDIRPNSSSYGEHFKIVLDVIHHHMMFVPKGMAHGFLSLEDDTIFTYKCTDYYHPQSEGCIAWNDNTLNIAWNASDPIISEKDLLGQSFNEFKSPF